MKIRACRHWINWRNGIIVAGIASRLAVARQSCQSHPLLVLPSQRPHQDNDLNQRRKRFPERRLGKKNQVLGHLPQVHDIQCIRCHMYIYAIKQYLLWCLAEGHASKCWRQGFSVHLTARALRPLCSDLIRIISSFQETFFLFDPKRCIKKGSPEDNRSAKLPYPDSGKKEGLETTMKQH